MTLRAVALVVLDSVGIGAAPDAAEYGDAGSATLQHVAESVDGLALPNLAELGLGNIVEVTGVPPADAPRGCFGAMVPRSRGKDSTTGHWELAGVVLERPFPTYPDGFPDQLIREYEERIGTRVLGNVAASGTEIIEALGEEHLRTGHPIVYTSADSVFQVAAHVDVIPLERLYDICSTARDLLRGEHEVGRVIARPFRGTPGAFERTGDRHDLAVPPPRPTVLDEMVAAGHEVRSVGKVADMFAGRGITSSRPTTSNADGARAICAEIAAIDTGLVFANLIEFDQAFGHRNDPRGYAEALEQFDRALPEILGALGPDDAVVITADHGNDPTTASTDHSRERVPVLCAGPALRPGVDVGERRSFADCGATVADLLGVAADVGGSSFATAVAP